MEAKQRTPGTTDGRVITIREAALPKLGFIFEVR
jgi:hypothetical protein